ncbi:hypothetical protein BOW08_09580 [Solemya velum gill symbiont]|nr:hypothetical protein BOW08_09580 [Solemya velum gill symbiont]
MNDIASHSGASSFVTLGTHLFVAMLGKSRRLGVVYTCDWFQDMAVPADQGSASVMQIVLLTLVAAEAVTCVVERFYILVCVRLS